MTHRNGDGTRQSAAEIESVVNQADWSASLIITPLCPLAAAYFWYQCPAATTDLEEYEYSKLLEDYTKQTDFQQSTDQAVDDFPTKRPVQLIVDYSYKQDDKSTSTSDQIGIQADENTTCYVSVDFNRS
jgi:endo-alpha-1,4-polygalactosaminidase (GH114 family)